MRQRSALPLLLAAAVGLAGAAPAENPEAAAAQRRAEEARGRMERLRARLAALPLTADPADADLTRARLARLNALESEQAARLGASRSALSRILSVLVLFRRNPPPPLLTPPDQAKAAVRAAILARALQPELTARAQALSRQAERVSRQRRATAEAAEDLFTSDSELAERRARLEADIADQALVERTALAEAQEARAHPLQGLLGRGGDALAPPVAGPVVQAFGAPAAHGGRAQGITFRAAAGATVRAPAAGAVAYVGALEGYGGVVVLRLPGDRQVVLAGLEGAEVGPGRRVQRGEALGRLPRDGAANRSGGAELYLELRRAGAAVDPGRPAA